LVRSGNAKPRATPPSTRSVAKVIGSWTAMAARSLAGGSADPRTPLPRPERSRGTWVDGGSDQGEDAAPERPPPRSLGSARDEGEVADALREPHRTPELEC